MSHELVFKLFCLGSILIISLYVVLVICFCDRPAFEKESSKKPKHVRKKGLTSKHKIAIIIRIIIVCAVIMLCFSDAVNQISILFTIAGFSCFQFCDFIRKNAITCSINFRYKIENNKSCKCQYADGLDDCLVVYNTLFSLFPIMFLTVILSVASSNWFLPETGFKDSNFICAYVVRIFLLMIFTLYGFIGIYRSMKHFERSKLPCVDYPLVKGDEGNYFEIKLKDGENFSSKEQFFYPVSHERGILLLFLDGTSLIVSSSTLEDPKNPVIVHSSI